MLTPFTLAGGARQWMGLDIVFPMSFNGAASSPTLAVPANTVLWVKSASYRTLNPFSLQQADDGITFRTILVMPGSQISNTSQNIFKTPYRIDGNDGSNVLVRGVVSGSGGVTASRVYMTFYGYTET